MDLTRVMVRIRVRFKVRVRIRVRFKVRVRIRVRFKVRVRIRVRFKVRVRIRVRFKVKVRIRVRLKVRARNRVSSIHICRSHIRDMVNLYQETYHVNTRVTIYKQVDAMIPKYRSPKEVSENTHFVYV